MKTMTARDAKTHFGEFLDAMQREPVVVTKNDRPVGIMPPIQDAADTLIPEMFMDKEASMTNGSRRGCPNGWRHWMSEPPPMSTTR